MRDQEEFREATLARADGRGAQARQRAASRLVGSTTDYSEVELTLKGGFATLY